MSEIAVRVQDLGKKYYIGAEQLRRKTFRDQIVDAFVAPFRRAGKLLRGQATGAAELDEIIWALKGVSFDIRRGEVVGVIGRNGAGKSTLLKVLSRITEPTEGFAEIRGRVGSLLEVGTGFHPELTGRENIYLNGAILGMRRTEIDERFDEIVEFAETRKFLDTPVKFYSSGMRVRLAFAVAAHLEPEILIIDEVLSVGDAGFQRKSLGKMDDVAHQGRTVIFVSHNMAAVTRLCQRAILVENGRVVMDGPSEKVVSHYLRSDMGTTAAREWPDDATAPGNNVVRMRAVRVRDDQGNVTDSVDIRRPVNVEVEYDVLDSGNVLVPAISVENEEGVTVFITKDHDPEWRRQPRPAGRFLSSVEIPGNFLAEGTLVVGAWIMTEVPMQVHCQEAHAAAFQVVDSLAGDTARGDLGVTMPGAVRPLLPWRNERLSPARAAGGSR